METYSNAGPLNTGNSAPALGGRRHHRKSHKKSHKLRVVTKKVARHHLKGLGLKMRGGGSGPEDEKDGSTPAAGGRRRHHRKSHKRHGLFGGMLY